MLTLAIETSTPLASVALGDETGLLAQATLSMRVSHSESVMPDIGRLLAEGGLSPHDLGSVVVGAGPGSFTGVRVAASIAKGICFARGLPLFAYSGLLATAAGSGVRANVCALFDARRDEVYAAAYRSLEPPVALIEPCVRAVEDVLAEVSPVAGWTFAGDGAVSFAEAIQGRGGTVLPAELGVPRAATLLRLGREYPELGRVGDVSDWEPSYVRASGAERALEA